MKARRRTADKLDKGVVAKAYAVVERKVKVDG